MFRLLLLHLLVLFVSTLGKERYPPLYEVLGLPKKSENSDIYGTRAAIDGPFTFWVSFKQGPSQLHFCSGTLVSPYFIITAASCLDPVFGGFSPEDVTVSVGTTKIGQGSSFESTENKNCPPDEELRISEAKIHPMYSNGTRGRPSYDARTDVALIILKDPSTQPWVVLPIERLDCCQGEDLLNVGVGDDIDTETSGISLKVAVFPSMPYKDCSKQFENSEHPFLGGNKNMSAASSVCLDGDRDYCPLGLGSGIFRWRDGKPPVLLGIATQATASCSNTDPYVFTNVQFYMKWILENGVTEDAGNYASDMFQCEIPPEPFLGGGVDAKEGDSPYIVSVRKDGLFPRCLGALVSPKVVLTAASCVDQLSCPSCSFEAYIGGLPLNPEPGEGEVISVAEVILHPKYRKKDSVDLAILILAAKSKQDPVKLPERSIDCCSAGTIMRVYGWGRQAVGTTFHKTLQVGLLSYIPKKTCEEDLGFSVIHPKAVCAGGEETDSSLCEGDHGMPLIWKGGAEDIMIGVGFLNTTQDCDSGDVAQFLRIAFYGEWIEEQISKAR